MHLHEHELVNGIWSAKIFAADPDRLQDVNAEDILPELKERRELLGPLLLVEAQLFGRDCLERLELGDDLGTVESLN